nr:glycosyltransferase [Lachnospiraceae bacterium]
IRAIMNGFYQGFLDAVMKVQSKMYGYYLIDDVLTDEVMEEINRVVRDKTLEYRKAQSNDPDKCDGGNENVLKISREALSYAMAAQITREDRLLTLKLLSNHYDVKLYSGDKDDLLDRVRHMGAVDYDTEMPKVFKCSDINLNMTLRCIRSGIPLRALDIMGAGGFLLSNYQHELAESFIDGEEMVMYDSIEDMYEKAGFYLRNPDSRMKIAARGHDRVLDDYRYEDRIDGMLRMAGIR